MQARCVLSQSGSTVAVLARKSNPATPVSSRRYDSVGPAAPAASARAIFRHMQLSNQRGQPPFYQMEPLHATSTLPPHITHITSPLVRTRYFVPQASGTFACCLSYRSGPCTAACSAARSFRLSWLSARRPRARTTHRPACASRRWHLDMQRTDDPCSSPPMRRQTLSARRTPEPARYLSATATHHPRPCTSRTSAARVRSLAGFLSSNLVPTAARRFAIRGLGSYPHERQCPRAGVEFPRHESNGIPEPSPPA